MTTERKLVTAEELLRMPSGSNRYELVRGDLIPLAPTGDPHGIVVSRIHYALAHYVEQTRHGDIRVGETGYRLESDPDTVRAADVAWVAPGRIPPGTQGYPNLAPDLAVEVKSPSESRSTLDAKAELWLSYGSREVWVADPESVSITVYRAGQYPFTLNESADLDGGDLLPGFTSPVWRLFRMDP